MKSYFEPLSCLVHGEVNRFHYWGCDVFLIQMIEDGYRVGSPRILKGTVGSEVLIMHESSPESLQVCSSQPRICLPPRTWRLGLGTGARPPWASWERVSLKDLLPTLGTARKWDIHHLAHLSFGLNFRFCYLVSSKMFLT